jgi:hypothetical protein
MLVTWRGAGVCSGAFFFFGPLDIFGTASLFDCGAGGGAVVALGSCRLELNEDMKSTASGESPSKFPKCSTASDLDKVAA